MTPTLEFRLAQPHEAGLVSAVLTGAAARLVERGQTLWELSQLSAQAIEPDVRGGLYHLALEGAQPVGVFRFQMQDPHFWPEVPAGSSAFVHKLAVAPDRQGRQLAHALLAHACKLARQKERQYLRLDCRSGRPKLRGVYERFGFRFHSALQLGGAMFDRLEIDLATHRFNVFGRIYSIQREGTLWQAYAHGPDGKRSPAGFVVPDFITPDEMEQYLFDLFHESATPGNGDVRRIA
ncbi:MAG: GNAT family N-acetyltransferase [Haliea sp.]|nr:MAG: GNAT family N-acetyltransferase [Haliea sp.]